MLKLNNICSIISRGISLSVQDKSTKGNYYIVRLADIKEDGKIILSNDSKYQIDDEKNLLYNYGVQDGDLIMSEMTRTLPNIRIVNNPYKEDNVLYSLRTIFIRVNPNRYNVEFLKNILNSPKYNQKLLKIVYREIKKVVNGKLVGSGLFQVSISDLRNFEIPDISLEEQEKILKQEIVLKNEITDLEEKLHTLYDL